MSDELLNRDALVAAATEATGLSNFGEDSWQEGLDRLLHALLNEANLSEIGHYVAQAQLVGELTSRLRVTDWHTRYPEIGQAEVPAPVVILGQPRTGTTILFDLLAQDPRFRVPLSWEVRSPHPPPETATYFNDPRIAETDAALGMSEMLIPGFQAIHPSGALRAQECVSITSGDFKSLLFSTVFRVPSYTRWLLWESDMASAYRYHRRFLQLLQWRHPAERWLLKTPGHQWCLGNLFAEYPNAVALHTHRDPLKVVASIASLTAHLQKLASAETSITGLAAEWVDYLVEGNDRSIEAREDGTVRPEAAIDVPFRDLMTDTFATLASIYDRLGIDFTDDVAERMRIFLADNAADKHGTHTYTFSATGLDESAVRARTRRYEEYFNVPQERLG
jgi:Sulfotransferase family